MVIQGKVKKACSLSYYKYSNTLYPIQYVLLQYRHKDVRYTTDNTDMKTYGLQLYNRLQT